MGENLTARQVVQSFAEDTGGRFDAQDTSDVDIDWEYYVQTPSGQFYFACYAEQFENTQGEVVEHPNPGLSVRVVNYTDEDAAPAHLMMVIEDDPNGFQRDVAPDSVGYDRDSNELSLTVEPSNEYQHGGKTVRLRYSENRDTHRVIEEITAMG